MSASLTKLTDLITPGSVAISASSGQPSARRASDRSVASGRSAGCRMTSRRMGRLPAALYEHVGREARMDDHRAPSKAWIRKRAVEREQRACPRNDVVDSDDVRGQSRGTVCEKCAR